jgi:hypothetical protein
MDYHHPPFDDYSIGNLLQNFLKVALYNLSQANNRRRLMKRRWLVVSVAVAALAVLVVGGAVFAAGNRDNGTGAEEWQESKEEFINRVAEILGKNPAEVESAIEQAQKEQQDQVINDYINDYIDKLVENGRLTQAEADELKAWVAERPDAVSKLAQGFGFGLGGEFRPRFHAKPFEHHFFRMFPFSEDEAPAETPSQTPATTSF